MLLLKLIILTYLKMELPMDIKTSIPGGGQIPPISIVGERQAA